MGLEQGDGGWGIGDGGRAKVQIGAKLLCKGESTEYRFQKCEDANFPVSGFPFRFYQVGAWLCRALF